MVTVSPCLWLSSLMMYFSREPPGPGEERLARILPALTHLTSDNNDDNNDDTHGDYDGDHDGDLSPDGGAGATLHSALQADVDAGAGSDYLLAHLVIT